jgi:hypothetical protein
MGHEVFHAYTPGVLPDAFEQCHHLGGGKGLEGCRRLTNFASPPGDLARILTIVKRLVYMMTIFVAGPAACGGGWR